jgi:hypothetical protein
MLLGATLLSTGGIAVAAPPHWVMDVVPLPDAVTPGADAGYQVTITNNGPSNVSALYLVAKASTLPVPVYPVYVNDTGPFGRDACTEPGAALNCSFGALVAGDHVTVIVGYATSGTGSFDPGFEANTTGVAFTDPKRSHGDVLVDLDFTGTVLNGNKNFGGGFNGSVGNSDKLNGQNKQSEKITHLPGGIGATVQDGTDTTGTCTPVPGVLDCRSFAGEWTLLNVNNGALFGPPGYFILQVHFWSGTPTVFVHSASALYDQEVIQLCTASDFDSAGGLITPCFTWDASTSIATIYLFHNSPVRG